MTDSQNEQIFDSLLEEMLTNQHPPDLTEVIQQRLRQELGPERFQQLRAGRFSQAALPAGAGRDAAETSANPAPVPATQTWGTMVPMAMALAACTMLAVAVWSIWPLGNASDDRLAKESAPVLPNPSAQPDSALVEAKTRKENKARPAIELPLESVPFAHNSSLPSVVPDRVVTSQPLDKLSDGEIVGWVDDQFANLWKEQELGELKSAPTEEVLARINSLLADSNSPVTGQSPTELSSKLVSTAAFATNWSDRIADYWLKGSPLASDKDPAAVSLRKYLAQQLVARRPWNEVLAELIGTSSDRPQSALLVAFAGGDNHRLAGRLGSLLLDEALACARCHDASDNGRVITTDQDQYWSLVAIFSGIDVDHSQEVGKRQLVDRQPSMFEAGKSPNVFFDRPDGRLQAAHYRLPGGDNWRSVEGTQTPRESLAKWIATTTVTDQASVNMAWRMVFGRPLVAQHSALDGEGLAQRRAVLNKLSEQFRAHNRDMGQLVSWLVASRPFAAQTLSIDRARWVTASDAEVARWNQAVTNFAAFVPKSVTNTPSLDGALAMIDSWSGNNDDRRTMLAQPIPVLPGQAPATNKTPSRPSAMEPPATYLVRSLQPTAAQQVFIKRLSSSKLSWSQQVDHIAGLVGEQAGNARLHSTAQKLLDAKNGDRSAALFQLLQGALLCHESM